MWTVWERIEMYVGYWQGNLMEYGHLYNRGLDNRVLKWILEKQNFNADLGLGRQPGIGKETSGFHKMGATAFNY